jgi:hypothetical protein
MERQVETSRNLIICVTSCVASLPSSSHLHSSLSSPTLHHLHWSSPPLESISQVQGLTIFSLFLSSSFPDLSDYSATSFLE